MEPDHPIVILRLAFIFLCALPAVRELFQYINNPRCVRPNLPNQNPRPSKWLLIPSFCFHRKAVRMGQHVWLLLATVLTEVLVILKWSKGQFPEPFPAKVKWGWAISATMLVLYPTVKVSACFFFLSEFSATRVGTSHSLLCCFWLVRNSQCT